jgi:hypothetical protein
MRATCSYCGAVNDVASEGALRLAEQLKGKIRVAPKLMTAEQIDEEIAERGRIERAEKRQAMLVTAIILGVVFTVGLIAVLVL